MKLQDGSGITGAGRTVADARELHPVGRVRVRTHEHMRHAGDEKFPIVSGMIPSFPDVSVSCVNADGSETPLEGVMSVAWRAAARPGEPCSVLLEVVGAELQADAVGLVAMVPLAEGRRVPSHVPRMTEERALDVVRGIVEHGRFEARTIHGSIVVTAHPLGALHLPQLEAIREGTGAKTMAFEDGALVVRIDAEKADAPMTIERAGELLRRAFAACEVRATRHRRDPFIVAEVERGGPFALRELARIGELLGTEDVVVEHVVEHPLSGAASPVLGRRVYRATARVVVGA